MKTPRSNWLRWGAGVILGLPLTAGLFFLLLYAINWGVTVHRNSVHGLSFKQTTWQTDKNSTEGEPTRLRMVNNLLATHKLNGLTQNQVIELLGPPEVDRIEDWDMVYSLGPNRGLMRMDTEFLAIQLNKEGIVSNHKLITN